MRTAAVVRADANQEPRAGQCTHTGRRADRSAQSEDDEAQRVIVCAWVDHGSVGLGIYYGGWTMDEGATALRDLRAAIVRRG